MAIKLETAVRRHRRVLLYGAAKTLKTTTAARFPKALLVQDGLSRGAEFLLNTARASVNTLDDFVQLATDADVQQFGTVVLDDLNVSVKRWTDIQLSAMLNAANGRNVEPRQAYQLVYKRLVPALQALWASPIHVVITAHYVIEQEFVPGTPKVRQWVHPAFPDALETYLTGMVDVVAYTYNNGKPSALVVESANDVRRIVAGHRVGLGMPAVIGLDDLVTAVLR